jgi:hypothetical protein
MAMAAKLPKAVMTVTDGDPVSVTRPARALARGGSALAGMPRSLRV